MTQSMRNAFALILIGLLGTLLFFTWGQTGDDSGRVAAAIGTVAMIVGVGGVLGLIVVLLRPPPRQF